MSAPVPHCSLNQIALTKIAVPSLIALAIYIYEVILGSIYGSPNVILWGVALFVYLVDYISVCVLYSGG